LSNKSTALQSLTRLFKEECSGRRFLVDLRHGPLHLFEQLPDHVLVFGHGKMEATILNGREYRTERPGIFSPPSSVV